ncbi:hypothetical protein [Hanstruepera marina]|uniref:hypothetical protein n=1 Tax=Hanstruepera marina TaxID=2873265 RepID=UPI001CA6D2A8|nr:hypothetical protein [Hanstruepera marina]
MKTIKKAKLIYLLFFTFIFQAPSFGQEAPENVYVEIGCIKSKSNELGSWLKENGIKFNKAAQEAGAVLDWVLVETMYPNGEECKCDYRMVTVFTDMKQLDMMIAPDFGPRTAGKAFGDKALEMYNTFQSMADFVGSQIYILRSSALQGPSYSAMSMINFIQVDDDNKSDYRKIVDDVWMPAIREAVKAGHLRDFSVWERIMGGADDEGNYITVLDFDSFTYLDNMKNMDFPTIFKKVHPDKDLKEIREQSDQLSEDVKQEIVRLVAALNKPEN